MAKFTGKKTGCQLKPSPLQRNGGKATKCMFYFYLFIHLFFIYFLLFSRKSTHGLDGKIRKTNPETILCSQA